MTCVVCDLRRATGLPIEVEEDHGAVLKAALSSVEREISARVAAIKRKRNGAVSINRIPTEILVDVVDLVLEEFRPPWMQWKYYHSLTRMALVCSQWQSIIENTPSLWSLATSRTSPGLLARALARYQPAPLTVLFPDADPVRCGFKWVHPASFPVMDDEERFLQMVLPHAHRWRTVTLDLTSQVAEAQIRTLPAHSAPLLEKLSLAWKSDAQDLSQDASSLSISDIAGHRLRELTLVRAFPPLEGGMHRGLADLDLSLLVGVGSSRFFLDVLIHNPELTRLRLAAIQAVDEAPVALDGCPIITLHCLTSINICDCSNWIQIFVLAQLRAPRLQITTIGSGCDPDSIFNYTGSRFTHLVAQLDRAIAEATDFVFKLSSSFFFFMDLGPLDGFWDLEMPLSPAELGWLVEKVIRGNPNAPIDLCFESGYRWTPEVVTILNRLKRHDNDHRVRRLVQVPLPPRNSRSGE